MLFQREQNLISKGAKFLTKANISEKKTNPPVIIVIIAG
jgi:hypothetical protein